MNKKLESIIKSHLDGKLFEAKEEYLNLISSLSGEDLEICSINLGNIFYLNEEKDKAKEYYQNALSLNSNNEKVYFNLAMVYFSEENLEKAKEYFLQALEINPYYLSAYINLAIIYKKLEFFDEAINCYEKALSLEKNDGDIYYNYANVLMKKEYYNNAIIFLEKSLTLNSKKIYKTYYSLGVVYQNQGLYKKALEFFNKSLEHKKDYADAHFAKATILLLFGDFINGWREYSYRWDAKNELQRPTYKVNWFNGQSLKNKRVLVQQEQGFGDNIQFIRYVDRLVADGATVFLAIKKELHRLFSSIKNINIVGDSDIVENIDYFTSLLDLPNIYSKDQKEFFYKDKYLAFIKEEFFELKGKNKLNIGFVWRGNPSHKGDKKRSIDLKYFEILFQNSDVDFYSLQFDNSEELNEYKNKYDNIYDCKSYINDFNDTANIVSKFDLVITIDSSMAHLCGALGIKTWLLLNKFPEWRWLLNRDDSIWYKSLELIRQDVENDWQRLLKKVDKKLKGLKNGK